MKTWSRGRLFLFWFGFFVMVGIVKIVGDQYLRPLPTWELAAMAVVTACLLVPLVIYSRRRARRATQPR